MQLAKLLPFRVIIQVKERGISLAYHHCKFKWNSLFFLCFSIFFCFCVALKEILHVSVSFLWKLWEYRETGQVGTNTNKEIHFLAFCFLWWRSLSIFFLFLCWNSSLACFALLLSPCGTSCPLRTHCEKERICSLR